MPLWRVTLLIPPYGSAARPYLPRQSRGDRVAFQCLGLPLADFQPTYAHVVLVATQTCEYCVSFEQYLPIVVASDPTIPDVLRLWPTAKHYD